MNLLILQPNELKTDATFCVDGRRHSHLKKILKVGVGDKVKTGILGQSLGTATILSIEHARTRLQYTAEPGQKPPPGLKARLVLALPRPPVLRRVLVSATTLGFKQIHIIHAARVEKSYWQSPELESEKLQSHLILGLEQAVDIALPEIHLHKGFKPFAEDVLPGLQRDFVSYMGDPRASAPCPTIESDIQCNLLVGPEGGWVPFELELLGKAGVELVRLGPRILRVETALPYFVGCLNLGND